MCIIIDTNTFSSVFDRTSGDHHNFSPVLNWIIEGEGKIIYGGSKYKLELRTAAKFLKLFGQLKRSRKVIEVDEAEVDKYQADLEIIERHKDFDDSHLVAICYVSKCRLICSVDKRAFRFLTRKDFYPQNSPRPSIYSGNKNSDLLCRKYFAPICEPCERLNKENARLLRSIFS